MYFIHLIYFIIGSDFPISTVINDQFEPVAIYVNSQYNVFWVDYRWPSTNRAIYGARVTDDGSVLDPKGELIFMSRTEAVDVAFDGVNFLVVLEDSC